ncbi:MAG: exodeoxyribonuclease VII large subunit [Peptococcaceae bacterium]|jgi:exodeoxyribonuclease VII large subunit|nr:exodeoxyribonuclease VII large subunit [Peptococcaceae bacterium]MDH7525339.1 exodeoxyribonuclease VII large subunit [Peptococcaceae bacterium]
MCADRILKVSDLAALLQKMLDDRPELSNLWVRGEISNFKKHAAGHLYFSIKDEKAAVRAVMFKSRAWSLNFLPRDGMDCLVRGYVSLYPREVMVQFYVEEIIPAGIGLQHLALEEIKKKLQEKGYFAPERKRPLPFLPRGLGVVTSPTGAAIRDIHHVVQRRYPGMPVILYPALVQGDKAAQEVAEGLRMLGAREDIDVIIVARGGGSMEDLGVFNTETVAEAVFKSPKPVISAVGHEIDYTITDLVADVRAATPTAAGELAVPVKDELFKALDKSREKLYHVLQNRLERERMRLGYLAGSGALNSPARWLRNYQEELAKQEVLLFDLLDGYLRNKRHELQVASGKLQSLSPLDTLARGFSICKDKNGRVVFRASQVELNETVGIQLFSGRLECVVTKKEDSGE